MILEEEEKNSDCFANLTYLNLINQLSKRELFSEVFLEMAIWILC